MRILFIGDIMGRSGREALESNLPMLRRNLRPDMVIVNGENAASGAGITPKICDQFYNWGVDCITTGNHVWDQREIIAYIARDRKLLRPLNFPPGTPGNGAYRFHTKDGRAITVVNIMARLFMDALDDPFRAMKEFLETEKAAHGANQTIFVDIHGETSSEKMSFAHHFDGQVTAVVGTHTHIPTADAHVMKGGTAYMTDAGMTGDYDSVIGVQKSIAMHRFVKKMPGEKMKPANGPATLCGCLVEVDPMTGRALKIDPVRIGGILSPAMPII